ncbi:CPBP family intramembrane metalloprotease [Henriciella mobilis]|uniref:CPBP family glutamic-type intramembrane protease n=1 Tax=Henriciella mobilis TaxID=2305467 RepID=UPI000E65FF80|nr:CPBP family glutamic-type intramembrane protease [Henriciella mobilis]RIJ14334.1 CPBP family intramembrane metalloprotease [Henriciella mobilis]RIJ19838.1 CPBP family intramembrane metalloprotease [Henriciella mobilis]
MTGHKGQSILWALGLWIAWTGATWWLEGRINTLGRPDAVVERLIYAILANLLIGVLAAGLVLRRRFTIASAQPRRSGFGPLRRSALFVPAGLAAGLLFYMAGGAPSLDPVVILNAYAQVFVVSMAEVMVCWAVVAGSVRRSVEYRAWLAVPAAAIIASVLFGVYHFAHSAPFNTPSMVAFLSVIGLVTSAVFFLTEDLYATIAFHNALGTLGIVRALDSAGSLAAFETVQWPLIATAFAGLCILVAVDVTVVRPRGFEPRTR